MPLQNRVTAFGEIVAHDARGTMMGNRGGALHGPGRKLGGRRWVSRQWICCLLAFGGRRRAIMAPGRYTELFFLDEATALAAGHRPCFECRREDAKAFARHWSVARGLATAARADDIDQVLHGERTDPSSGAKRLHAHDLSQLPDGCLVVIEGSRRPMLVLGSHLRPWSLEGYGNAEPRPSRGNVAALTPPSIIAAMKSGYVANLHESARDPR